MRRQHQSSSNLKGELKAKSQLELVIGGRATTPQPRRLSEFEERSLSIVQSQELWAQFQSEARANHISTAVGLREMLVGKHVAARRISNEETPNEPGKVRRKMSIKSLVNATKFWEGDSSLDFEKEAEQDEQGVDSSIRNSSRTSFHEHDYRNAIRGKTNSVLALYKNMEDANNRVSFRRSLSDFTDRWAAWRESVDEESTVNSLRSSLSLQIEDVFDDSMRSLDEIAAAAACNMLSKSTPTEIEANKDLIAYSNMKMPGGEVDSKRACALFDYEDAIKFDADDSDTDSNEMEDVRPFTFTTLASLKDGEVDEYESDNDSYDDRSNNGQFEFPLESRQKAELKRSYGASQDICKSTWTRSTRDSTRTTLTSYTSAGRDSMLGDALEPNNKSSDLLVEWPDVTRRRVTFPSVHPDEKPFERESYYPRTQFSKQTSHRKCCDIGSNTITTNQWTNLKYNTSLAKAREKQLKRASISSIYDLQLKPIAISTSSVTKSVA
jgi:hypothetical protein